MRRFFALSLLGTALTASSALAATIATYSGSGAAAAFNSSSIVGGSPTFTENFNTNTSLFTTFTTGSASSFTGGLRNTQVTFGYSEVVSLNSGNMTAFGANWDLSYAGAGA